MEIQKHLQKTKGTTSFFGEAFPGMVVTMQDFCKAIENTTPSVSPGVLQEFREWATANAHLSL
jgi:hypothetical protein